MYKKKVLKMLQGDIPLIYSRNATYHMCLLINMLVKEVNRLSAQVEKLSQEDGDGKIH